VAQFWAFITFVNNLFKGFFVAVGLIEKAQADHMKKENQEAIGELTGGDQRKLERDVFKNPNAGEASGLPGAEYRDSLPGVLPDKK